MPINRIHRVHRHVTIAVLAVGLAFGLGLGTPAIGLPGTPSPVQVQVVPPHVEGPASLSGTDDPLGTTLQIVQDAPHAADEFPCLTVRYYFFEVGNEGEQELCPVTEPCVPRIYCPDPD